MKNHWDDDTMGSLRTYVPAITPTVADHYLWAKSGPNKGVARAVLAGTDDAGGWRLAHRYGDQVGQDGAELTSEE